MTPIKKSQKRLAPLSLRLNSSERKALEKLAGDQSLGAFIKDCVFGEHQPVNKTEIVDRYTMLARTLAALGESEVFANLDIVAKAIEAGELSLCDEQEDQIAAACLAVLELRNDLIRALGLKPPPIFDEQEYG